MTAKAKLNYFFSKGALAKGDRLYGLIRFALIGGSATLTYLVTFALIHRFTSINVYLTSLLAYGFGFCVSYVGQSLYTFRLEGWDKAILRRFLCASAFGAFLSYIIIIVCTDIFHLPSFFGAIITAILIPFLSFLAMNFWVFLIRVR